MTGCSERSTSPNPCVEDSDIKVNSPNTQKVPKYSKGAGSYTCEPSLLSFPSLYSLNSTLIIEHLSTDLEEKEKEVNCTNCIKF